jgi:hypothetical protein
MQVTQAFRGVGGGRHPLVTLYFAKRALSEIGMVFEEGSDYETQVFLLIANKIAALEAAKGKHGPRHSN